MKRVGEVIFVKEKKEGGETTERINKKEEKIVEKEG